MDDLNNEEGPVGFLIVFPQAEAAISLPISALFSAFPHGGVHRLVSGVRDPVGHQPGISITLLFQKLAWLHEKE